MQVENMCKKILLHLSQVSNPPPKGQVTRTSQAGNQPSEIFEKTAFYEIAIKYLSKTPDLLAMLSKYWCNVTRNAFS